MSCWTTETQKIINAHKADFNSYNWQSKLKSYGGYSAYLKRLGGVFAKWDGKNANVRTAAQFQEIAQYVFGLMAIYGFNYNNGQFTVRWGGGSPFYPSADDGRCNWGTIDDLCSRSDKSKTTNCNFGMDSLYYKAGIMPNRIKLSDMYKAQARKYKVIRNKADLRIGDLVHMFGHRITSSNPDTWYDWHHVCCVGEKRGNTVIMYDSGSRFISSGDFKHELIVDRNNEPDGDYSNYHGWVGIRVVELVGNNGEVKTDKDIAVEVIAGKWGKGEDRKKRLGAKYDKIQTAVNYYLMAGDAGRQSYLRSAAAYVLKGFAGKGMARKRFFGKNFKDVQNKVNWAIRVAQDVIKGKYGNDEERKKKLGDDYDLVQAQVNRMV